MSNHVYKVDVEGAAIRLDVYLAARMSEAPSRSFVKRLIDDGHVRVNESIAKAHYKLHCGDDILVSIPADFLSPQYIQPENIPLNIFYEDDQLLIINKPSGLLVHPAQGCYSGTLVNALLYYSNELSNVNSDIRPGIVHRLDQDTSGLMIVAKDNISHTKLARQFARHTVRKKYVALVKGSVDFDEGKIDVPIGRDPRHREKKAVQFDDSARKSLTFYKVLKRSPKVSLVALYPRTGRTHQLRVHMAYLRHPILGDEKYGQKSSFPRLALHAQSIGFQHPLNRSWVEFSSLVPPEFLAAV